MTWQECCDLNLVRAFARLKLVSVDALFENLNGADELALTEKEIKKLKGTRRIK